MSHISYGFLLAHQLDSAVFESRRALADDSLNRTALNLGAMVRLAANLPKEARELADRAGPGFYPRDYVIAKSGDPAAARKNLQELEAKTPQPWMTHTRRALGYLGLGDTTSALSALERATAHLMGCLGKAPQSIRWQIATGSRGDHFCVVLSKALA